jgi:hypothetical protein
MHPEQSAWLHSSFIASGENLFKGDRLSTLADFQNALNGPLNSFPVDIGLGNDASHFFSVARNGYALSPLNVVEDFEETGFGF